MNVAVTPATEAHALVFGRLLQLYYYDFSEILGVDVGDDGLFSAGRADGYWLAPRYRPFLIHAGAHLAGLAVVDSQSRLTGEPLWDMAEFFVVRRHRRTGVGAGAASWLFDAFPGLWEVREVAKNTAAQAFWRRVIGEHTGGRFHEVVYDDATWRGPVQKFESKRA
jgi:predicted acetyltransferase